jgi:hypothetical protein
MIWSVPEETSIGQAVASPTHTSEIKRLLVLFVSFSGFSGTCQSRAACRKSTHDEGSNDAISSKTCMLLMDFIDEKLLGIKNPKTLKKS